MAEYQTAEQELKERRRLRHESRTSTTYKNFLKNLCAKANLTEGEAEKTANSVLCILEQRITGNEAHDMEAQLPLKLRELLHRCEKHEADKPERFGRNAFVSRAAEDLGKDAAEAESLIRAVFETVRDQISEGEANDVAAQLPTDLKDLWRRPA